MRKDIKVEIDQFIEDWYWDEESKECVFKMGKFLFSFIDYLKAQNLSERNLKNHDENTRLIGMFESGYGCDDEFLPENLEAFHGKGEDYMYRQSDREAQAMSPMFLGGLTARAIKLKNELKQANVQVIEVYPGGFVKSKANLKDHYHKKDKTTIPIFLEILSAVFRQQIETPITNYHQVDSVLALLIGIKYMDGLATSFGDEDEGLIWI